MKYDQRELALIWLDSFSGLDYTHKQELYKLIDGKAQIKALIEKAKDFIINSVGVEVYNEIRNSANGEYLNGVLCELEKRDIKVVTILSDGYPEKLKNTNIPPLVLYCKGDVGLLNNENLFGVVGSRKNIPIAEKIATNMSKELVNNGFVLVTGLAVGIDSVVLNSSLSQNKQVISVITGGFDNIYPTSNINLFNKVVESGLVITEYPPTTKVLPYQFPVRNRIIAGLSKGVLIVSGGKKSGTLYTAEYAEEYGRDLFVVPYSVGISCGEGCNDLIKRGAMLTDCPQDILSYYGIEGKEKENIQLSEQEREIVELLKDGEMHIEKICAQLNKKVFEVSPILSMLEIKGVVVRNGVNIFGVINRTEE